jgi:Flp pilus assembly protein TadG
MKIQMKKRGSAVLEFVLMVPFALILLFITMDIGKAVLIRTALQDATATAARAAARLGYIGSSGGDCSSNGATNGGPAQEAFCEAFNRIPGASYGSFSVTLQDAAGNSRSGDNVVCDDRYLYVVTVGKVTINNLLTPRVFPIPALKTVSATSVARCEVSR